FVPASAPSRSTAASTYVVHLFYPTPPDAPEIYTLSLHDALPIFLEAFRDTAAGASQTVCAVGVLSRADEIGSGRIDSLLSAGKVDRKSTRLNSSHVKISYAVFCLKKKKSD